MQNSRKSRTLDVVTTSESADPATLDLTEAADELGVHYQTAYRWVRTGRLPAVLVKGRYRVATSDLRAVDADRNAPKTPDPPSRRRRDGAAERMFDLLVDGDETAATRLAHDLAAEGLPIVELVQHVLAPPLRRIGAGWANEELTIWVEHRASAIVERVLGTLAPNPRGRRRGTAVVAAVSGDRHAIATLMAAVVLRDDNWHVHHLGADMPPEEIERFCVDHDVSVVALSVTGDQAAATVDDARVRLAQIGVPVVVGGAGRTLDDLVDEVRAAARTGVRR